MIVAVIVFIIVLIWILFVRNNNVTVRAADGRTYSVVAGGMTQQAADRLAMINEFLINFMRHLRRKYIYDGVVGKFSYPTADTPQKFVERLLKFYNSEVIREHIPEDTNNTSYVLNKGTAIVFCLRSNGTFEDTSTVKFVALHELTHIGTLSYGHETDFWENFKFVLTEARDSGLYVPIDYERHPVRYCGLDLNYNPLF